MKRNLVILAIGLLTASGCAAGAATAGYSMKAGTADELKAEARKSIIDEAVEKAYDKMKNYVDEKFALKSQ